MQPSLSPFPLQKHGGPLCVRHCNGFDPYSYATPPLLPLSSRHDMFRLAGNHSISLTTWMTHTITTILAGFGCLEPDGTHLELCSIPRSPPRHGPCPCPRPRKRSPTGFPASLSWKSNAASCFGGDSSFSTPYVQKPTAAPPSLICSCLIIDPITALTSFSLLTAYDSFWTELKLKASSFAFCMRTTSTPVSRAQGYWWSVH